MAKQGYVYILINPSLKGMLKVGQTQKDPEERAKEISQGTGVPTPFIVAFKEMFNDCVKAEMMIHMLLEEEGYRVNKNREFFEAELSDIIRKILLLKEHMASNDYEEDEDVDVELEFSNVDDLFSDFEDDIDLETNPQSNPWDTIEDIADAAYYGLGDELQDYEKAYEYYTKAFKLGSPTSPKILGMMHERGEGVRENKSTALTFFKEGVARGNVSCWANIGSLYVESNISNAKKAYSKYFAALDERLITPDIEIYHNVFHPLYIAYESNIIDVSSFNELLLLMKLYDTNIIEALEGMITYCTENNLERYMSSYKKQLKIIENGKAY